MNLFETYAFDDIKLAVNPESVTIEKKANVVQVRTLDGFIFQKWPDLPDSISFRGKVYGERALRILKLLQEKFHKPEKLISFRYKSGAIYYGYFSDFRIAGEAGWPGVFDYNFTFIFVKDLHFKSPALLEGFEKYIPKLKPLPHSEKIPRGKLLIV